MSRWHRVLIVEDDKETAHDLCEIVRPLNGDPLVFDNAQEARLALEREEICCAVLDLEIKTSPDSIKGNVAAGLGLVRDVRQRYPDHVRSCFAMPIVVISGHAPEAESAVQVMKYGADDVIQKPLDVIIVTERLRQALLQSGRTTHADCGRSGGQAALGSVVISVLGDREKRRTLVEVGTTTVTLTDAQLVVLLHLIVGRVDRKQVHKTDLGARDDQGFRGISELSQALAPGLPTKRKIIGNDHQGHYWLTDDVEIGPCAFDKLVAIGDHRITELAEKLRERRDPKS